MKLALLVLGFTVFLIGCAPIGSVDETTPAVTKPEPTTPIIQVEEPTGNCIDFDKGKVYDIAATVEYNGETFRDRCTQANVLKEYYCLEDGVQSILKTCDKCKDGVCENFDKGCTDTDGGVTYDEHGFLTDAAGRTFNDTCNYNGKTLTEYYCDTFGYADHHVYTCDVCVDGACV